MTPACLALVRATTGDISRFLDQNAGALTAAEPPNLSLIQTEVTGLMARIAEVGVAIRASSEARGVDDDSGAEMRLYRSQLERLKGFLTALQAYAEIRRDQLGAGARQAADVLEWSKALELTRWEAVDTERPPKT